MMYERQSGRFHAAGYRLLAKQRPQSVVEIDDENVGPLKRCVFEEMVDGRDDHAESFAS